MCVKLHTVCIIHTLCKIHTEYWSSFFISLWKIPLSQKIYTSTAIDASDKYEVCTYTLTFHLQMEEGLVYTKYVDGSAWIHIVCGRMGLNTHTLGYFGVSVDLIKGMWTEGSFLRYTYHQCEAVTAAAVKQYLKAQRQWAASEQFDPDLGAKGRL